MSDQKYKTCELNKPHKVLYDLAYKPFPKNLSVYIFIFKSTVFASFEL